MGKQKLINSIKKDAKKQIEAEIKLSVIKELYGTSKKAIKKLKKQILKELRKDMFVETSKKKKNKKAKTIASEIVTNPQKVKQAIRDSTQRVGINHGKEEEFSGDFSYEPGRVFEYKGFKFDVDRMSAIVTGKKQEERPVKIKSSTSNKPTFKAPVNKHFPQIEEMYGGADKFDKLNKTPKAPESPHSIKIDKMTETLRKIKKGEKSADFKKAINRTAPNIIAPLPPNKNFNTVPATKNLVKTSIPKLTPAKKEEVEFFVGKLKEEIDKLGKGEKNINYRRKTYSNKDCVNPNSDVYVFMYDKPKSDTNDFSLSFELDFDIYTYGANIVRFNFNIGGFKFDNSFVEVIDMAKVLDAVGMNLSTYIDEIEEISSNLPKRKKRKGILEAGAIKFTHAPLIKKEEPKVFIIRANTKVETFIDDAKIVNTLNNNEIFKMKDLNKYENFSDIKGIGEKSSKKILDSINDYLLLKQK